MTNKSFYCTISLTKIYLQYFIIITIWGEGEEENHMKNKVVEMVFNTIRILNIVWQKKTMKWLSEVNTIIRTILQGIVVPKCSNTKK